MKTPPQQLSFDFGSIMPNDSAQKKEVRKVQIQYAVKMSVPSKEMAHTPVATVLDMTAFKARREQEKTEMLYRNILASVQHLTL